MKKILKCRQNKWSEIGKDIFVKMRKNTCILIDFNTYKMRKNTQRFSNNEFCKTLKINKMQNQEKIKMNKIYQGLGNARSIR